MNKRYLILIVTAFLAMVLSDRTGSQECIDIKSIFHALALCRSDYSGTYAPERLLISLRKLVI